MPLTRELFTLPIFFDYTIPLTDVKTGSKIYAPLEDKKAKSCETYTSLGDVHDIVVRVSDAQKRINEDYAGMISVLSQLGQEYFYTRDESPVFYHKVDVGLRNDDGVSMRQLESALKDFLGEVNLPVLASGGLSSLAEIVMGFTPKRKKSA